MSPLERVTRAQRALALTELGLLVVGVLVALARRRVAGAARELGEEEDDRSDLAAQVSRLRAQLDGALEALHERQQALDTALDIQGSEQGEAFDTQGSEPADQAAGQG